LVSGVGKKGVFNPIIYQQRGGIDFFEVMLL